MFYPHKVLSVQPTVRMRMYDMASCLLDALAGRAKDGEHHRQEAHSGEESQRSHDSESLRPASPQAARPNTEQGQGG